MHLVVYEWVMKSGIFCMTHHIHIRKNIFYWVYIAYSQHGFTFKRICAILFVQLVNFSIKLFILTNSSYIDNATWYTYLQNIPYWVYIAYNIWKLPAIDEALDKHMINFGIHCLCVFRLVLNVRSIKVEWVLGGICVCSFVDTYYKTGLKATCKAHLKLYSYHHKITKLTHMSCIFRCFMI